MADVKALTSEQIEWLKYKADKRAEIWKSFFDWLDDKTQLILLLGIAVYLLVTYGQSMKGVDTIIGMCISGMLGTVTGYSVAKLNDKQ